MRCARWRECILAERQIKLGTYCALRAARIDTGTYDDAVRVWRVASRTLREDERQRIRREMQYSSTSFDLNAKGDIMKTKERFKAVQAAIAAIEKQFGKGAIMPLDGSEVTQDVDVIPTGSLALDVALGVGGLPRGRVVEIYGPESSGKTTLTLHAIARGAARRRRVRVHRRRARARSAATRAGSACELEELLVSQPDCGEQALEIADKLVRSGAIDLIVVDSVAALTPQGRDRGRHGRRAHGPAGAADEPGAAQAHRGHLASRTRPSSSSTSCGRRSASSSATPRRRPAATRSSSTRRCGSTSGADGRIKNGEEVDRQRSVRVKVVKNKCAPPFREAEFDVHVRHAASTCWARSSTSATTHGLIEKSGAWYMLDGERIGQGRDKACAFLAENPEIVESLRERLLSAMKMAEPPAPLPVGGGRRGGGGGGMSALHAGVSRGRGPSCVFGPEERLDVAAELMATIGAADGEALIALPAGYVLAAYAGASATSGPKGWRRRRETPASGIVFGIDVDGCGAMGDGALPAIVRVCDAIAGGGSCGPRRRRSGESPLAERTVTFGRLRMTMLLRPRAVRARGAAAAVETARPELVLVLGARRADAEMAAAARGDRRAGADARRAPALPRCAGRWRVPPPRAGGRRCRGSVRIVSIAGSSQARMAPRRASMGH